MTTLKIWDGTAWQTTSGQGANGQGVPTGGATSSVLIKNSAGDYDTKWSALGVTYERIVAATYGGTVGTTPNHTQLTAFTMPLAATIVVEGWVRWDTAAGQPGVQMIALVEPSANSTPAASVAQQWSGPPMLATGYGATVPFSAKWATVASGTVVSLVMKYSTSAAAAIVTQVWASVRLIPGEF
jgi:hypothetical protein